MNQILNHDSQVSKPSSSSNHYPNMDNQKPRGNSNSKNSIQNLYKNQLDSLMQEKQKLKRFEKQKQERQKEEYRQKLKISQQNEKLKDLAYKNYYKMLMESQDQNAGNYKSPYEIRDKLKDSLIQNSIHEEMKRSQNFQYQKRMQQAERKNQYKQELTRQIQERKKLQEQKRNYIQQQNILYRQQTKGPLQIESYRKEKKKEEMQMYRNDLDRIMQDKLSQSRRNVQQRESQQSLSEHYHNPLINPLPYNIQNPYILKQMQKLSSPSIKKDIQYQDERQYQMVDRQRNESSYLAKQGNKLLQ